MALSSWEPFREMEWMRREVDRIFENFGLGRRAAPFSRFSFLPGRAARAYPLINLCEDADNVYVEALAPGLDPDSLRITVVRNQLTISGEKPVLPKNASPEDYHRSERAGGKFTRGITLPIEVESDGIKAEYKNGLLRITLPRAELAKPRQIPIHVG